MKKTTINAYAKINLSIDVLGKRADGYHEVLMVMQQVDLSDHVTVEWHPDPSVRETQDDGIRIALTCNLPFLPNDSRNLAWKAAELMSGEYFAKESGRIVIHIEKRIPVAAGLAGGSADCAAVLHALNLLWGLKLDLNALKTLGAKLGADVAFCLAGQAALNRELGYFGNPEAGTCAVASGIGEQLEMIPGLNSWILLSKPPISLSTAEVYRGLKLEEVTERPNTAELKAGLREGNLYKISKNMTNILENYSLKEYPNIMYTKNKIVQEGKAYKALMSGSGPTVFGLFTSKSKGLSAYKKLKELNRETFLIKTL